MTTKSSVSLEDAKARIISQDVPRNLRRSAVLLFEHECQSIDPDTGKRYSKAKALSNVLKWMYDCKMKQDRISHMPTPIQLRRLQMLIDGMSHKQIAVTDQITLDGIKQNFKRMRRRLKVKTIYQAIAISVSYGWLDVDDLENR